MEPGRRAGEEGRRVSDARTKWASRRRSKKDGEELCRPGATCGQPEVRARGTGLCEEGGVLAPGRHRLGPPGDRRQSPEVEGLALQPGSLGQSLDHLSRDLGHLTFLSSIFLISAKGVMEPTPSFWGCEESDPGPILGGWGRGQRLEGQAETGAVGHSREPSHSPADCWGAMKASSRGVARSIRTLGASRVQGTDCVPCPS